MANQNTGTSLMKMLMGGGLGALGSGLPFLLSLFGGRKQQDVGKIFQKLWPMLAQQLEPGRQAGFINAQNQGNLLANKINTSISAAGAGGAGPGAAARGVGAGLSSTLASQANQQFFDTLSQLTSQLAGAQLGAGLEMPSGFNQFQAALGQSMLMGQNPFSPLIDWGSQMRRGKLGGGPNLPTGENFPQRA